MRVGFVSLRMIIVTGSTGTIGQLLVQLLLSHGKDVRIMARDPAKAKSLFGEATAIAQGDFTDDSSLERAFEGASAVFVLSSPGNVIPSNDAAALKAVLAKGVARVVKMSAIGVDAPAAANLASSRWHGPGETALLASGREFTILRASGFASNALAWRDAIRAGRPIESATGSGRHPFVDPRDVAEVAFRALTTDALANRTLTLTGPRAMTAREQLDEIERAVGQPIASLDISLDVFAERMRNRGLPPDGVANAVAGQAFVRDGHSEQVFEDLPRALGRPARSFAEWLADHAEKFR